MTVHISLPATARVQLQAALGRYRKAIEDLETAVIAEAWETLHSLQGKRDLEAHTIAVIVNASSPKLVEEGVLA